MKKHLKLYIILTLLLFIYSFIVATSYTTTVCSNIADSVFRLHVIANSDSQEDQNLKYIVRDDILNYVSNISKSCHSKSEIIDLVKTHINDIQKIAQNTVYSKGYSYPVNVKIGNFSFPTKTYGDISLPSGFYDALRIEIGNATGKNWWCVMFPPLCFIDVTSGIVPDESKDLMKENLSDEEFSLISTRDKKTKFKFKIIEVLQNLNINGILM